MATSAIQQSAFAGQTALKQSNELVRKAGSFGGDRATMRRTIKSAPQSIWIIGLVENHPWCLIGACFWGCKGSKN